MKRDFSTVEAIIEIPRGGRNKYEIDHATGEIRLDRVLFASIHYPADYGFIPNTKGADGDPLDALVLVEEPTFPGCHIQIRPIGVLLMRDEKGVDEKILGVPLADPRFEGIKDISQIQKHWLIEIENFFNTYKVLERKEAKVEVWKDSTAAKRVLRKYWSGRKTQVDS
ncbi:MAG TPA: inorganic diphosphatase [Chloroflexi bacterium]|nr:inorganic diphosphatase [Chloroflexota bacterium]